MTLPLIHQIDYQDPHAIFSLFSEQHGALFLDSALKMPDCGDYSYICFSPFLTLSSKNGVIKKNNECIQGNPFDILEQELKHYQLEKIKNLPPFQGGAAGFFGYELYQHLENIPFAKNDDMKFPDMAIGFYDLVLSFDHVEKKAWIVSSGFPEKEEDLRIVCAIERSNHVLEKISMLPSLLHSSFPRKRESHCEIPAFAGMTVDTSTMNDGVRIGTVTTNEGIIVTGMAFTKTTYLSAVQQVINYILNGDIFEANISQRFQLPLTISAFELYSKLRELNPAPFSAFFNFNDTIIASASPERFLKLTEKHIETRPIKGTRPRGKNKIDDEKFANELMQSEKDHAENVMIVDLMRNDLSRVCEDRSVHVTQLCGLESYATVHHLVSVVHGKLKNNFTAVDLLKATFPGGSITGAPKIRAMEIIAEIEPTYRGPYCGSLGFIGFNGDMDTSILIRTYCIKNNIITFQTGGAVVLDSNPEHEYEETLTKARALMNAYDLSHR